MWGMHSQNYDVDNSDFFLDKKKKIHSNVDKKKRPDTSPVLCLYSEALGIFQGLLAAEDGT